MIKIDDRIVDYIRSHNETTYVEIEKIFTNAGFFWQGDMEICDKDKNHVYWSGWNEDAIAIVDGLCDKGFAKRCPTEALIYVIDGGGLKTFRRNPISFS